MLVNLAIAESTNPSLLQLAISLFSCIYFLNDKMKNLLRASSTGYTKFISLIMPSKACWLTLLFLQVWSSCWWLDHWFTAGPVDSNISYPSYMVARASDVTCCICFHVPGMHIPKMKRFHLVTISCRIDAKFCDG
jgi:hypothetical protein